MATTHRFQAGHLHAMTRGLLMGAGTPRHIAEAVAEILVNANLAGHDSHGVIRLPAYLRSISEGSLIPTAEPNILEEGPNTMQIDGQHGFGHYVARQGMSWAIEKAGQADVCCASFINTGHIGRLGEYAEMAARAGVIGITTFGSGGGSRGITVPFGGIRGAMTTNPISVGVPTGDEVPFILDFATSVVAEGKLQVARSNNVDVPEGYIVDKNGRPTVKTADFYDGGYLLPFGTYKGYALALLVNLLGGLSGNFDLETGWMEGEFMIVINIEAFLPLEAYQQGVRAFLDTVKTTPPAAGFEEVLVPGDFEHRSRTQRLAEGIELPDPVYGKFQEWAARLDISLDEDAVEATDLERYEKLFKP